MTDGAAQAAGRVLILAPVGRDGEATAKLLDDRGHACAVLAGLPELACAIGDAADAVVITEEAMALGGMESLVAALDAQPAWSDLPFVVLTRAATAPRRRDGDPRAGLPARIANAVFLERPLSVMTLVSAVEWALAARRRQFQLRDHLAELQRRADRIRAGEDALKATRLSLEIALNSSGVVGAWDWDIEQNRVVADARFATFFSVDPEHAAKGAPIEDFVSGIHPDDRGWVGDTIARTIATSGEFAEEYRLLQPDGRVRWIFARGRILPGEPGEGPRFPGIAIDITERRESLEALQRAERRQAEILDGIGDGFYALNHDLRFTYFNAASEQFTGLSREDVIGRTLSEIFPTTVGTESEMRFKRVLRTGVAERWQADSRARPGQHVDMRAFPTSEGIGVGFTDISERMRAESALRLSNDRFATAVDAVQGVIWTNSADGRMEGEQPAWNRLTGQDRAAYQGYGWIEAVHPDDRAASLESWQAAVAAKAPYIHEHRVRRADGSWRLFSIQAIPVIEDGVVREWVGVHTDVTDQRSTERQLRDLNESLEARVAARTADIETFYTKTPSMLHSLDMEGRLASVSDQWLAFMGYDSLDDVIDKPLTEFMSPEAAERFEADMRRLPQDGRIETIETQLIRRSGEVAEVEITARAWHDGSGAVQRSFASVTDVTARKRAEAALRQAQKMEAVGQLTGGIAHDFNNMLAGIIGAMNLIRRRIDSGRTDDIDRFLDAATTSARRGAALIQRLLAFSRRQSLDPQPIDTNALVVSMEDLLRRTLGEQVRLEFRLGDDLPAARADANQLESALLNLAINARDAMPDGGSLTVETTALAVDAAEAARHDGLAPGGYVVLSVGDTGTGMAPDILAKIFDPFFTTKPIGQGTGLGMSMIYGFVKQSGGHIRIDSQPGQGTTVMLYLPRAESAAEADAPAEAAEPARAIDGECVLVVEDDPAVRMLVMEVLADLGYHAYEAGDANEALPCLQSDRRIDLLVSDVGLPGMNGRQLAEIARQHRPGLKVLFMTGYAENAINRDGFLDEGMEMMTKPFGLDDLATRIRGMMEGG